MGRRNAGTSTIFHAIQTWLAATPAAPFIRDVVWVKALLESAHILADGLLLFSAGMMGARLVFRSANGELATDIVRRYAPWVWGALAVAVCTGLTLLTGAGRRGLDNPMFQIKLATLLCAVLLTAGLQLSLARGGRFWAATSGRRTVAATVAALGFLFWLATVFAGRLLAYSSAFFDVLS